MTSTEQLKDICERFQKHQKECTHCDLTTWLKWNSLETEPITIMVRFCPIGRDLLLDIFN